MTTELKPAKPVIYIHGGKLYRQTDHPLFHGVEEMTDFTVKTEAPGFIWKGTKIPFNLWAAAVSFMRWGFATHKEEVMATFFYKPDTGQWAVWAFAQRMSGLAVNYIPEHVTVKEDRAQFGKGWIQFGSIHHHCTIAAFSSGTDKTDEANKEGVHFTTGHMDKAALDLHCRQVFGGFTQDVDPLSWVAAPEWIDKVPAYLSHLEVRKHAMKTVADVQFPDVWKERIIKTFTQHPPYIPNGNNGGAGSVSDQHAAYYEARKKDVMRLIDDHKWAFDNVYALVVKAYAPGTPDMTTVEKDLRWRMIQSFEAIHIPQVFLTRLLNDIRMDRAELEQTEREAQLELSKAYGHDPGY